MFSEPETSATVWRHFTKTNDKNRAVCSLCQKSIKTQGGTKSGVITVINVLYKNPKTKETDTENETLEVSIDESDTESDDEDDEFSEIEIDNIGEKYEEKKVEIVDDFKSLIQNKANSDIV